MGGTLKQKTRVEAPRELDMGSDVDGPTLLEARGLRVETDLRNEKIGYKVREHSLQKVPNIIAVGGREVEERTVALRQLGEQGQKFMSLDEALDALTEAAKSPLEKRGQ